VIQSCLDMMELKLPQDSPLRRLAQNAQSAVQRGAALTQRMLAFARKQELRVAPVDIVSLVANMTELLRRSLGPQINIRTMFPAALNAVKTDANQLELALMNLAVNARDAMPTGGKLTIEVRTVQRDREDLGRRGIRPKGSYTMLAVTDAGSGMDAETQAHIFEPFFTTKESGKGTGLGLATVYGIVQQHGGWIDVYSEVGHGTTFRIYLPAEEGAAVDPSPAAGASFPRRTATILLVEDQAAIRMLAEDVLVEGGHRVISAASGRAALELVEKHQGPIDLLITDVVMPEMSGPDLADQLSRSRNEMIVLYISGYTDHALLHRRVIEQGTAFLQKPFLPESLLIKVDELLRAQTNADGAAAGTECQEAAPDSIS